MPSLRTDRLRLRPLEPDDLPLILRIHTDPELMRHVHTGRAHTFEECRADLAEAIGDWRGRGAGGFVVTLPGGELVGTVGVGRPGWLAEVGPAWDVGWTVLQDHQGRGYATEAARAVVGWFFDVAFDSRLLGIHNTDNVRSAAVMDRLGMRWVRQSVHPEHGFPIEIWETTATDWRP